MIRQFHTLLVNTAIPNPTLYIILQIIIVLLAMILKKNVVNNSYV